MSTGWRPRRYTDRHIQPVPGSDLAVALGLLRLAVESGAVERPYLADRTVGWDQVLHSTRGWTPSQVAAVSGVGETDLAWTL